MLACVFRYFRNPKGGSLLSQREQTLNVMGDTCKLPSTEVVSFYTPRSNVRDNQLCVSKFLETSLDLTSEK